MISIDWVASCIFIIHFAVNLSLKHTIYFSYCAGACDVGTMKPSPVPFMAISQRTGVPPNRILFIGDSFEKDVLGASAAGMTGGLLARKDFTSKTVIRQKYEISGELIQADSTGREILEGERSVTSVTNLDEMNREEIKYIVFDDLYPEEMKLKINRFFQN